MVSSFRRFGSSSVVHAGQVICRCAEIEANRRETRWRGLTHVGASASHLRTWACALFPLRRGGVREPVAQQPTETGPVEPDRCPEQVFEQTGGLMFDQRHWVPSQ